MITLRSDGDDDQPRDENGQWTSGGGLSTLDHGPSGFAQGTTKEIAEAFGVAPKEALALLQKAAKEGLVVRRGHEGTVGSGKKESIKSGFGYQMWELMNSTKLP